MVVLAQILLAPPPAEALSWRLPGGHAPRSARSPSAPAARQLREVPPPEWVQRAHASMEERDPRVRILAPADGELLPDRAWTLRVEVANWPLVDAGRLGLGTHLVAQLDDQPPRPFAATEVEMPPLSPGTHRLTVYAAMPWGEAHKSPLALQQIRIHRLAPNPATVPAPGTPQLIAVSPMGSTQDPPLLLDWLLIDAPLQGLRGDASGWRLRLTLNGESVLLDQQMPLWLQGWAPGSNALLLELLDGRGDPLNPPFNSLLQEVSVPGSGGAPSSRSTSPSDVEQAVLLGEKPPSALLPASPPSPPAASPVEPPEGPTPAPESKSESEPESASARPATVESPPLEPLEPLPGPEPPPGTDPSLEPMVGPDSSGPALAPEHASPPPSQSALEPRPERAAESEPERTPTPSVSMLVPEIAPDPESAHPDAPLQEASRPRPMARLRERLWI